VSRRKSLAIAAAGLLAVVALLAGCSSAPLTDPHKIISNTQATLKNLQSIHFHLEAGGQFAVGVQAAATDTPVITDSPAPSASSSVGASSAASGSALVSASPTSAPTASPTASPSPSASASAVPSPTPVYTALPVTLDGTKADGDIDFANKTAHIIGGMPGLPGLSGELIIVSPYSYFRAYGGTMYAATAVSDLAINPADPSMILFLVQQVVAAGGDPSLSPTLVGTEQEASGACYHIRVDVTQAALASKLANLSFIQDKGSARLDLWITQNDFQLERLEFSTSDPAAGTAAIRLVLSNWNNVAPIKGPPADQFDIPGLQGP
jgi:hypothetical protein